MVSKRICDIVTVGENYNSTPDSIDTTNLPRKGNKIHWRASINCEIPFIYDGIKGKLIIKEVYSIKKGNRLQQYIVLQYMDIIKEMRLSSLTECKLGFVLTNHTQDYILYDKEDFKIELLNFM